MSKGSIQALQELANTGAILNEEAARQQQTAQRLQFAAAAAQPQQPGVGLRQQSQMLAPQAITAQAQPMIQAQQATAAQQAQVEAAKTQQIQADLQRSLSAQEMAVNRTIQDKQLNESTRLNQLGIDQDNRLLQTGIKQMQDMYALEKDSGEEIFQERKQFAYDEVGRKFTSERQLADWTVSNIKDKEEFQARMNVIELEHEKSIAISEALFDRLTKEEMTLRQKTRSAEENALLEKIAKKKAEQNKILADKQAKAANTRAMIGGAFTVAGAIAGGVLGGAPGAGLGASLGGAAGNIVSEQAVRS